MAFDEAFVIHERITIPLRSLLGHINLGIFFYAWVIPYILLLIALTLFFFRFFFSLSVTTRFSFFIAAALYLGGAVGFEFIEGHYVELNGNENLTFSILTTIEESMEMAGCILFIRALLVYLEENYKEVLINFNLSKESVER